MNKLIIKQNTVTENVTVGLISKLYSTAKAIKDYEELNDVLDSLVELLGNLLVVHAYKDEVTYLETKFSPNLNINVTGGTYIKFEQPYVALLLMEHNLVQNDRIGITESAMQAVTAFALDYWFRENAYITKFNELKYFTNLHVLNATFYRCTGLEEIDLRHVTSLPLSAFLQCSKLKTVGNTANLQSVANNAFIACVKLELINLSNTTTIGTESFNLCTSLTEIDLSSCTSLGNGAFLNCTSLTTVTLNPLLTSIGNNAFNGCTSLTSIDLSNCTTILHSTFKGCTSLTSVDISNMTSSTNSYSNGIFQDCTSLQTVVFPTVLLHNGFMFCGCTSLGINEDLDITLASYSQRMFKDTGYRTVTLHCHNQDPNSWTTGNMDGAFCTMPNVTKLDFSDTTMPHYTLSNNTNLTTLILPTTYSTVFWNTFSGSNDLLYIVILATTPPTLSETTYMLHGNYHRNANVYVPDAVLTDYQTASGWSNISTRIKGISELPSSVTWYTKEHPST